MGRTSAVAALIVALAVGVWLDRPKELLEAARHVQRPNQFKEFSAVEDEARALSPAAGWAGSFSTGPGLSGTTIYVLPSGRYCLHDWADIGSGWSSCGRLRDQRDRLASESKAPWESAHEDGPAYLKVPWGRRRYLVPVREILEFVNAVNSGLEPRTEHGHGFGGFLRRPDEALPAPGLPELPEPHRRLLRAQPVSAKVIEVGFRRGVLFWAASKVLLPIETPCRVDLTLDDGSNAGLFVGMELHAKEDKGRLTATVTSLSPGSAEARVRLYACQGRNPRVGEVFSTR